MHGGATQRTGDAEGRFAGVAGLGVGSTRPTMPGRQQPRRPTSGPDPDAADSARRDRECERLYQLYRKALLAFFLNRRVPASEAKDLLQETFLSALQGFAQLRSQEREEPWLFRIAQHTLFNWTRHGRAGKRAGLTVPLVDGVEPRLAPEAQGEPWEQACAWARLLVEERHVRFRDALAELPELYQQPLMLHYHQDRSYEEIGTLLAIPLGTVKSRIHEGKLRLKAILGEDHEP